MADEQRPTVDEAGGYTPLSDADQIDPDGEQWRQDRKGRTYVPSREGSGMVYRAHDDETVDEARERDRIQRATGTTRAKQRKDPKPKARKPPAKETPKLTNEQLAAALEVPLALPAIWARMAWGCEFCANNFATEAPAAALDLAKMSERSAGLRRLLEIWYEFVNIGSGSAGIVRYAGRPLIHHMAPEPMAGAISPFLGVPPRVPVNPNGAGAHTHTHPGAVHPFQPRQPRQAPNAATPPTEPPSDSAPPAAPGA